MVDEGVLGSYIERPKMYTYDTDGETYNFTVTLLNTKDPDEVIRNWHLAFMLTYQNLPNRTSKVFLEPPVIYEVEVPGTFYSPFAYIESLRIINRGATRVMKIPYYNLMKNTEDTTTSNHAYQFRDQVAWDKFR